MNKLILFIVVLLVAGCKEKFVSPVPPVSTGYLVMEGVVNNDGGETNIKLSRTTPLNDDRNVPEIGATVTLESNNNTTFPLMESFAGNYAISTLHLDTTLRYRLSIKTSNSEEYQSDYVAVRNNPPIDSVSWLRENNGVNIYINTHDPFNNTHYYQWDFNETWEFHSAFFASLKFIKDNSGANVDVTYRDPGDPQIFKCWQSEASTNILLGSSAKLSKDLIYLPIENVPPASWKISVLYSILVKQYAWSKEGYEFLSRMKKNTESVGSVFDAQPSELNGNLHCISDPQKPVIGFLNICSIREQRIYIDNRQVPDWGYQTPCREDVIENNKDSIAVKAVGKLPTSVFLSGPFGSILTFNASTESCVDCTLRGTNVKPSFWP